MARFRKIVFETGEGVVIKSAFLPQSATASDVRKVAPQGLVLLLDVRCTLTVVIAPERERCRLVTRVACRGAAWNGSR
jgi:hypothetical protein